MVGDSNKKNSINSLKNRWVKGDGKNDESDYFEWKLFNLTSAEIFELQKLITS